MQYLLRGNFGIDEENQRCRLKARVYFVVKIFNILSSIWACRPSVKAT